MALAPNSARMLTMALYRPAPRSVEARKSWIRKFNALFSIAPDSSHQSIRLRAAGSNKNINDLPEDMQLVLAFCAVNSEAHGGYPARCWISPFWIGKNRADVETGLHVTTSIWLYSATLCWLVHLCTHMHARASTTKRPQRGIKTTPDITIFARVASQVSVINDCGLSPHYHALLQMARAVILIRDTSIDTF